MNTEICCIVCLMLCLANLYRGYFKRLCLVIALYSSSLFTSPQIIVMEHTNCNTTLCTLIFVLTVNSKLDIFSFGNSQAITSLMFLVIFKQDFSDKSAITRSMQSMTKISVKILTANRDQNTLHLGVPAACSSLFINHFV